MIEPFLVQELPNGSLSLTYQKVGEANVLDFYPLATAHERNLIKILQQFSSIKMARELKIPAAGIDAHLIKLYQAADPKSKALFSHLKDKASQVKMLFFNNIDGSELLFEMRKDGYPAAVPIYYRSDVRLWLHYQFSSEGIAIRWVTSLSELSGLPVQVLDDTSTVILIGQTALRVPPGLRPVRLKPFSSRQQVDIQPRFMDEYIRKFVLPDLSNGVATLSGNAKQEERLAFSAVNIYFSFSFVGSQLNIFETKASQLQLPDKLTIEIAYQYGSWKVLPSDSPSFWKCDMSQEYHFQYVKRDFEQEIYWRSSIEKAWQVDLSKGSAQISFAHLRDVVLPALGNSSPAEIQIHFSPEFRQLVLKPAKLNINYFDKIDYFQIEGTIDWEGNTIDLETLRRNFSVENGWLRFGDQYLPLSGDDQLFLSQLFNLSFHPKQLAVTRKALVAIQQGKSELFSRNWEKLTAVVSEQTAPPYTLQSMNPEYKLREYQYKGLDWMLSLSANRLGGILADDMGLGKTFQAAAFLLTQVSFGLSSGPILIVLPNTLIFNWEFELKRFSPQFRIYVHAGPSRSKNLHDFTSYFNVVLVSYQTLTKDVEHFTRLTYSVLIIDEAHNLKNAQTSAYKAVQKIQAYHTFLLTGTPLQNSPVDLWSLSELCNPGLMGSRLKPASMGKAETSATALEKLNIMKSVLKPLMLRRTKAQVLEELPPKSVTTIYCTMSNEQSQEYLAHNAMVSSSLHDVAVVEGKTRSVQILKALTRLRLLANHPALVDPLSDTPSGKFELVLQKLEEVLSEGHKVLIFSSFVRHLQIFARHFDEHNILYSLLTGHTRHREEAVQKFKSDSSCNVFLISMKAGGVGLNLTEASYVFLLDPWWNPAVESQAMDRVYRIGQQKAVSVYKFIALNTVEEKILELQNRKQILVDQLFDIEDEGKSRLTIEMLREILLSKTA